MTRGNVIINRLLQSIPNLFILTIIAFGTMHLAPGDPIVLQVQSLDALTSEQIEAIKAYYGLDKPVPVQYVEWLGRIVRGDLGVSWVGGEPVASVIGQRVGPTILLTGTALSLSVVLGILFGVISARFVNTWLDHLLSVLAFFSYSIPSYWASIVVIILFAVQLDWFPASGMQSPGMEANVGDVLHHLVLPALILGLDGMASITRYVRSSTLEVISQDYIRTARAKGLRERNVITRHALRNALLPVITILGLRLPGLLGGAVLVETVFAWPGMGREAVLAAYARNYPVTMALVVIGGVLTIVGSLLADVLYQFVDPRIDYNEA